MNAVAERLSVRRGKQGWELLPEGWQHLPGPDAGVCVVPVAGGVLLLTPQDPSGALGALLTDLGPVHMWLAGVFGEEVAQLVLLEQEGEAVVEAGELALPLRRLGVALWLHRWWPSRSQRISSLDELLLRAEIGAAAWESEPAMPDLGLAAAMLGQGAPALLEAVARIGDLTGAELDEAERLLRRAVRATLDEGDVDPEIWQKLDDLDQQRRLDDERVKALLDGFHARMPQVAPALVAGRGGGFHTLVGDVDWLQVNPRSVASHSGNVTVEITSDDDGVSLLIQVDAGDEPVADGMRVRVYLGDEAVPVEDVELVLDGGAYVAEFGIPVGKTPRVDVYDLNFLAGPPRFDEIPEADRELVSGVIAARLESPLANPSGPFLCELLQG